MTNQNDFDTVDPAVKANIHLIEELSALDFTSLDSAARDLLLSQMKKTIGKLGSIIQKNESR